MLRETLLATLAALAIVAAYLVSEANLNKSLPAPDEAIRGSLDRIIEGEHEFTGTVRRAIEWMQSRRITILVEWPENDEPYDSWKIPASAKVNITLRNATVEQWLTAIAVQSRGSLCHYLDHDGRIRLSTRQAQQPPLVARVYDVRDLLAEADAIASMFPASAAWHGWSTSDVDAHEAAQYALEAWVKSSIREWTWEYWGSGGPPAFGHIHFYDGRMLVLQTPQAQREIAVTLAALRARQKNASWRTPP